MATMNDVSAPGVVGKKLDPAASEGVLPDLLKNRTTLTPRLGAPGEALVANGIQAPPNQPTAPGPNVLPQQELAGMMPYGAPSEALPANGVQAPATGGRPGTGRPQPPRPPQFNPMGVSTYMQQFSPENTIRATRITGGQGPTADSQAVDQARSRASTALPDVDRGQIAGDILSQLIERTNPQYEQDLRNVNKAAAAGGRLGAGITTTRLGDVTSNRQQFITDSARQLASEAAGLTLDDQLAKGRFNLDTLGELRGLEGQRFDQGYTGRQELRGERDYENTMANDARSQEIERMLLEDQMLNSSFGRDQQRLDLLGRYGFGGNDPSGVLMQASGNTSAQASGGGLLDALLYDQARRRA